MVTNGESDGRTIHWVWEPEGGSGKNKVLVPFLMEQHGALLLDPTAKKCGLDAIAAHSKQSGLFSQNPIVIINLARPESHQAEGGRKLYELLERCQDDFPLRNGGMHKWHGVYPHIIVTANVAPGYNKLIGRLKVHFINTGDELVPDTFNQRRLDVDAARGRELREEYSKSLKEGTESARYLELKHVRLPPWDSGKWLGVAGVMGRRQRVCDDPVRNGCRWVAAAAAPPSTTATWYAARARSP